MNIKSLTKYIPIKIRFGTPLTHWHGCGVFFSGCLMFAIVCYNAELQNRLGEAGRSILHSRGVNETKVPPLFFCDIPYNECLCSVLSNKSQNSEKCVPYNQLAVSRVLPLISFFLQIILIQQLFSFNAECSCLMSNILWASALLIFIGMAISIYSSSCYHARITGILLYTGGLVCFLTLYNFILCVDHFNYSAQRNKRVISRVSIRCNVCKAEQRITII